MVEEVVAVCYGAREEKRGGRRVGKKGREREREERIKVFRLFYS
jgi:hypothetical protein